MAKAFAVAQSRIRAGAHRRRTVASARLAAAIAPAVKPAHVPNDLQSRQTIKESHAPTVRVDCGANQQLPLLVEGPVQSASEESKGCGSKDQTQPGAMLYLRPLTKTGPLLQLQAFDAVYLEALRAGDPPTQEHFVCYFTELLQIKLRSRLRSPQAIEDVRQETFTRVLAAIRKKDGLRQPERLGPFVNTVCNNVLLEHYRQSSRSESLDEEGKPDLPARGVSALDAVASKQMEEQVREVLGGMPEHDRSLLRAVFLEERDREDVCQEFGVDRDYLRVLLHRAKQVFKAAYVKRNGAKLPFTSATGEA